MHVLYEGVTGITVSPISLTKAHHFLSLDPQKGEAKDPLSNMVETVQLEVGFSVFYCWGTICEKEKNVRFTLARGLRSSGLCWLCCVWAMRRQQDSRW